MSRFEHTLPAAYFDDLYARDLDPWRFASSDYEREKYAATLAALPRARYASVLEIGCSVGVLTRQLAMRAAALCAIDLSARALGEARRRCADFDHVRFECMGIPALWPAGCFDLIVLSEVVYYLESADVIRLAIRLRDSAAPGCDIVLVHWIGETHYPLSGDDAAEQLIAALAGSSRVQRQARTDAYRLDVLRMTT